MPAFDDTAALVAYKDWTSMLNTLWTLFSGAAVAFAGIATKTRPIAGMKSPRAGLAIGWVVFAVGNAWSLFDVQRLVQALSHALEVRASQGKGLDPIYGEVFRATWGTSPWMIMAFQAVLSLVVLAVVLRVSQDH